MPTHTPASTANSDTHAGDDESNKSTDKSSRRRAHRKSRYGCSTCKKRRIKCDERKPECANCKARHVRCDYLNFSAPSPHTVSNRTTSSPSETRSTAPTINIADAELMYYWTTSTACTLSSSSIGATYWRQNVSELALSHPYLLHLIFSLTALHLAYSHPARREEYIDKADCHYVTALAALTPELSRMDRDNCDAVVLSVQVVCSVTWARGPQPGEFLAFGIHGRSDWLTMFRGIRTTFETLGYDAFTNSGRPGILHTKAAPLALAEPRPDYEKPMRDLQEFVTYNSLPGSLEMNQTALDVLMECYRNRYGGVDGEYSIVFSWLFRMSDEFLETLQKHDVVPLVIYAHFTVLMSDMERFWYMKGWTAHVIGGIWDILKNEHRTYIRWPCSVVGWIPPI